MLWLQWLFNNEKFELLPWHQYERLPQKKKPLWVYNKFYFNILQTLNGVLLEPHVTHRHVLYSVSELIMNNSDHFYVLEQQERD